MRAFLGDERVLRHQARYISRQLDRFHHRVSRRAMRPVRAPALDDINRTIRKKTEAALERAKKLTPQELEASLQKVQSNFFKYLLRHLTRFSRDFAVQLLTAYNALIDPDVPFAGKAGFVMILLYFLNPFDLVPDFIPVMGFTDDLGVFIVAFAYLGSFVTDKHRKLANDWLDKH